MLEALEFAERKLRKVAEVVAWLAMAGLLVQCVVIFFDVASRWLFNSPLLGLEDITRLLVIIVITACFPASLLNRSHIAIRFLGNALGGRAGRVLDAFGGLFLLIFISMIAWQMMDYAAGAAESGEITWILRLPVAPAYWVSAIILLVCVPIQFVCLLVDTAKAALPDT